MEKTLYDKLCDAENINDTIKKKYQDFENTVFNEYRALPGFKSINFDSFPTVDIKGLQSIILKDYEEHPIVKKAIKRERSIEDTLKIMAKDNLWFKRFLPRSHNTFINDLVKEMSDLVYPVHQLKHKGFISLDNPLTAYTCFFALFTSFGVYMNKFDMDKLSVPAIVGSVLAICPTYLITKPRLYKAPFNQARYIDLKLQEIYK